VMASGDFHPLVSGHRGGRRGHRGGRSSHFRSRGRGKEVLRYQRNTDGTQSVESDCFHNDDQITGFKSAASLHGSSSHEHGGRSGKLRGRGRGSRRPYEQMSHLNDQPNSKTT